MCPVSRGAPVQGHSLRELVAAAVPPEGAGAPKRLSIAPSRGVGPRVAAGVGVISSSGPGHYLVPLLRFHQSSGDSISEPPCATSPLVGGTEGIVPVRS